MSLLSLGLALVLQGAPTHASLHPADADLFLEVPDVAALLSAYDQVPMMRLLRDDNVALSIQELTGEEFDFDATWNEALQSMVSPEAVGLIHSVRALSLSLSVPAVGDENAMPIPSFTIVVDFTGEEQAQAVLAVIVDQMTSTDPHPNSPLEGTLSLHLDEVGSLPLWAAVVGPRLVLGGGELQPSGYALRQAAGERGGLAGDKDHVAGKAMFESPAGVTVVQGYTARSPLDILTLATPAGELGSVMEEMGQSFSPLEGFLGGKRCWRMQLVGGRFLTEMVALEEPGKTEGPSLLGGRPLEPAWLEPIDPEAMLVYSSALDGRVLLGLVQEGLQEFGRQTGQELDLATIDAELGIPLSEVFGQLGPGLIAYAKPLRGVAIPETYAWIELSEPEAFAKHVAALTETLGAKFPGYSLRTRDYRVKNKETGERTAYPISTLSIPPDLIPLPPPVSVSPAFTVAEGMLLVSLSPMHLKRELKRLYSGSEEPPADTGALAAPLSPWGVDVPETAESVIVMDWGLLIGGLVSMAKSLGPMLPIPFDAQALPEPETITQYFQPTVHYSRSLEGAMYRRHEASFGPEVWLGGVAAGALAMREFMPSGAGMSAPPAPITADPVSPAGGGGQELATRMALQKVRTAITVYQLETKAYPSDLELLVQPRDSFPEGFLGQKTVPLDGWGRGLLYQPDPDNSSYRLWSSGANGIDEGGEGDDIPSR